MSFTDYADFLCARKEFDGMQFVGVIVFLSFNFTFNYLSNHINFFLKLKIYKLYKQEKHAIDNWAKTLWSNLNPYLLVEGIDAYISEFNKLDEWVGTYCLFVISSTYNLYKF